MPNARSLSRMRYFGALFHGNASVIWRANHSAIGLRAIALAQHARLAVQNEIGWIVRNVAAANELRTARVSLMARDRT